MPITKSAKKALRQEVRRRVHNLQQKRKLKNLLKKFDFFIFEKKHTEAQNILPQIYKILDKAAKAGLIKKNTASRKKSRITKLIKKNKN